MARKQVKREVTQVAVRPISVTADVQSLDNRHQPTSSGITTSDSDMTIQEDQQDENSQPSRNHFTNGTHPVFSSKDVLNDKISQHKERLIQIMSSIPIAASTSLVVESKNSSRLFKNCAILALKTSTCPYRKSLSLATKARAKAR